MKYRRITKQDEGSTLTLQPWGYQNAMSSPAIQRHIKSVTEMQGENGAFPLDFRSSEEPCGKGPIDRQCVNWRVVEA